jgi:hypothetical protein
VAPAPSLLLPLPKAIRCCCWRRCRSSGPLPMGRVVMRREPAVVPSWASAGVTAWASAGVTAGVPARVRPRVPSRPPLEPPTLSVPRNWSDWRHRLAPWFVGCGRSAAVQSLSSEHGSPRRLEGLTPPRPFAGENRRRKTSRPGKPARKPGSPLPTRCERSESHDVDLEPEHDLHLVPSSPQIASPRGWDCEPAHGGRSEPRRGNARRGSPPPGPLA